MWRWLALMFLSMLAAAIRPLDESPFWWATMGFSLCMSVAHLIANIAKGGDRHDVW